MTLLDAIEQFWLSAFLRRSVLAYPVVNALHIVALGTLVTSAALMDLRVLGFGKLIPLADVVHTLRPVAIGALILVALSGFLLFSVQPHHYAGSQVFLVKLALIAAAVANASVFVLQRRHLVPDTLTTRSMAFVSIALWLAVVMAGRSIAFFE